MRRLAEVQWADVSSKLVVLVTGGGARRSLSPQIKPYMCNKLFRIDIFRVIAMSGFHVERAVMLQIIIEEVTSNCYIKITESLK